MLSRPDSARLTFVGDQPTPRETSLPVRLPRSRRSSAASRLRRTVGLPDAAIYLRLLLRLCTGPVCHLYSPRVRTSIGCFLKCHAGSIAENFTRIENQD